jgi:hypothetical protein
MAIPPVTPGDPLDAALQNRLIDQVNANSNPTGTLPTSAGSAGLTFNLPPGVQIGLFQLTEAMQWPDSNPYSSGDGDTPYAENCKRVWFLPADDEYGNTDSSKSETLYHPTAFRESVNDVAIGHSPFASGQRCFALYNAQSGRWEIISPPVDVWRFELKDDLAPGGNATAYLLPWGGASYGEDTDIEFEVYDPLTMYRGRARSTSPSAAGSQGYAKYMPDRGVWEIVSMQPWATLVQGLLDGSIVEATATAKVDGLEVMSPPGGILPVPSPSDFNNLFGWDAHDNAKMIGAWNEDDDDWDLLQVKSASC